MLKVLIDYLTMSQLIIMIITLMIYHNMIFLISPIPTVYIHMYVVTQYNSIANCYGELVFYLSEMPYGGLV